MNIGPQTVVEFHYTLRNTKGEELESSRGGDPTAYLHGANNIIVGLETAMTGKTGGDVFSATIEPERLPAARTPGTYRDRSVTAEKDGGATDSEPAAE